MKNRILSIDILRGLGIIIIIVIHRLHYHWTGMQSSLAIREHFDSPWKPFLILIVILFTMAGIFYFISGIVNAFSFYKRVVEKKMAIKKVVTGGVVTGFWIFVLNYIHRLFFSNGFTISLNGKDPEFPAGWLVGWIKDPSHVQFYWSQISEPGTLAVIGLVIILSSLVLGVVLQPSIVNNKKRVIGILVFLGFLILVASPLLKFLLRPEYETAFASQKFSKAFFLGIICQEFSILPYLGYGLLGSSIGLGLAMNEKLKTLRNRNRIITLLLFLTGVVMVVFFEKSKPSKTMENWIFEAGVVWVELSIFFLLFGFLYRFIDLKNLKRIKEISFKKVREFGMVALTVYFFEPLVAEILKKIIDVFVENKNWTSEIYWVLLFALFCLSIWSIILHFWKKINFIGSLEWLSVRLIYLLAKKRSGKTEFDSIK